MCSLTDDEPQLHVSRVKKKTRIAVLGGSFDPITDGHLKMACEIINSRCADEVRANLSRHIGIL